MLYFILFFIFLSRSIYLPGEDPFTVVTPSIPLRLPTIPRPSGRNPPGFGSSLAMRSAFDIEREWNEKVNIPLRKVMNLFQQGCISCYFGTRIDLFDQHRTEHCPVSKNLMGYDAGLSGFKKKFDIPIGCCYGCALTTKVSISNIY
jgi:hypothetical protein